MEKTDLKKILSVSGEHGLFQYVAQARNGIIAESLLTGQRTIFGVHAKVTSLSDISIYTTQDEISLQSVLEKMAEKLNGGEAMSPKSDTKAIAKFFGEVIPDYDADRFYVSHMKKVLDWYSVLQKYATLEFVTDEEREAGEKAEEKAEAEEK